MVRHLVLGNGRLLINIDRWLQPRDLYFPHVGQENHLLGNANLIGLYYDGHLSWINKDDWERSLNYKEDSLTSDCYAKNDDFNIRINDCVHHKKNIYIRKIGLKNLSDESKELKIYFYQNFKLYGDGLGDTAAYDPMHNSVFHYKRRRYIMINSMLKDSLDDKDRYGDIDEASTGNSDGGLIKDAEDGRLDPKTISQGEVDSIFSVKLAIEGKGDAVLYYWIVCGEDYTETAELDNYTIKRSPERLISETDRYWKRWLEENIRKGVRIGLNKIDEKIRRSFRRSLLTIKTQIDYHGAILAANDSDNQQYNKDTYSYLWPRDGALTAIALQKAGFTDETKPFYDFCSRVLTERGFLLHKYNPDMSLGSSWLPYFKDGRAQLPIQEDETALVVVALWNHYQMSKERRFLERFYPMAKKMADFMINYRYKGSKLPRESYDLWEEVRGIHLFTCSSVCAGLKCASDIARVLKKEKDSERYKKAHKEVYNAINRYFYDPDRRLFARMINFKDKEMIKDYTLESSMYSIFYLCGFDPNDKKAAYSMEAIEKGLRVKSPVGGAARYKYDRYHSRSEDWDNIPGNPWFISTLWLAKWHIEKAKDKKELNRGKELLMWAVDNSLETGIMPEQIDPFTGEPLSVSPLTWSHAEFIDSVIGYIDKIRVIKG